MKKYAFVMVISLLIFWSTCFAASIPQTLNYQGALQTNTGQPVNVPTDITFSLYTTPIGTEIPFWSETMPKVPVSNGQFSVTLGATSTNQLDPSKFSGDTYIGIKVGTNSEMMPRQKMTSVPYAFNGIPRGGIIMWSGAVDQVPIGWVLCDGVERTLLNGTKVKPPNLKDRFIVGAVTNDALGNGAKSEADYAVNIQHDHSLLNHTHGMKNHNHKGYGDGGDLRAAIGAANAGGCKKVCVNGHSGVHQTAQRSQHDQAQDQAQRSRRCHRQPAQDLQDPRGYCW